jgi:hypothetical protein
VPSSPHIEGGSDERVLPFFRAGRTPSFCHTSQVVIRQCIVGCTGSSSAFLLCFVSSETNTWSFLFLFLFLFLFTPTLSWHLNQISFVCKLDCAGKIVALLLMVRCYRLGLKLVSLPRVMFLNSRFSQSLEHPERTIL